MAGAEVTVPSAVHANFGADSPRNKKVLGTPFFPGPNIVPKQEILSDFLRHTTTKN